MEKKRMMIWKLNEGIMYLFEETQGIKNFSILQKLREKIFNSPKKIQREFSDFTKIQNKNFQSYENSEKIFPILRKIKIKIF